ncbi:hypothetical protein [Streptomyces sp. CB03911]|uniref:hypothetical protein n=1 Tax=Streptomyces sp. CB03911 TaxID=1804758 RepID=UPI00094026DA|nr:hypothetical protein [Streptomyces sp. CB03911]OKI19293.1 hypothetical protein A6A07_07265 [Streptomyces sp. CB03911]
MTFGELRRLLNTVPIGADNDPVMVMDLDTVELLDIKAVEYEGPTYDEGGNVTSLGGIVWLKAEAH